MSKNLKVAAFVAFISYSIFMVVVGVSFHEFQCKVHDYDLVSIEYLEDCQCGSDKMECYKSFVDGYEYKECKECGSYYDNKGDN